MTREQRRSPSRYPLQSTGLPAPNQKLKKILQYSRGGNRGTHTRAESEPHRQPLFEVNALNGP